MGSTDRYAAARHHTLEECNSFGVQIPEAIDFMIWLSNPHNTSLNDVENFETFGIQTLSRLPPLSYACFNKTISTGMALSNVALSRALSDTIKSGICPITEVTPNRLEMVAQLFPANDTITI